MTAPSLSVVIVTYNSADALGRSLPPLAAQLGPDDELVVVDNASADATLEVVARLAPDARVVEQVGNDGFAGGCNIGADAARGELLVFLNPDAVAAPDFAVAIRRPLVEGRGWAAWQGLVTAEGGTEVNTSGNVVHFTGISWAGEAGRPIARAELRPREVGFASGACLAVPRERWRAARGFPPEFFMYCEDLDLSLRMRLGGGRIGLEPSARVDHEYEFAKGPDKWRLLERNRWSTIVRTYPGAVLAMVAPALLATELALVAVSVQGGWGREKARAAGETLRALPRLLRERRLIQAGRTVSSAEFAAALTAELSSPYLGRVADVQPLSAGLRAYWALACVLLGVRAATRPLTAARSVAARWSPRAR